MKIGVTVVSNTFAPAVARCSQMIAKGFSAIGHSTELVVAGCWDADTSIVDDTISSTCLARRNDKIGSYRHYMRYMRRGIREGRWDLIVFYSVAVPFPFLISYARRHGAKVVYFQADQWPWTFAGSFLHWLKLGMINAIDRHLARRADLIVLGGTSMLKMHFTRIAPLVKTLHMWVPIDCEFFAAGEGDSFRKARALERRKLVVYCGSIHAMEGVDDLIRAMSVIRRHRDDATLVLAGSLCNHVVAGVSDVDFPGLTRELGLEEVVLFCGMLSVNDVRSLLHAADVLVMPKKDHLRNRVAAPIKLAEYLSSGKPVVVTRVGEIAKYLEDRRDALLCAPGDPEGIAECILEVLDDAEFGRRLGENGVRVACTRMDCRAWASKVLEELG